MSAFLDASDPFLAESLKDLLAEGPEHLEVIERELMAALGQGACDGLSLFRAFHTLKGIFGFLGFEALGEATHLAESRLEGHKMPGAPAPEAALCEGLLFLCDQIKDQLEAVAEGLPSGKVRLLEAPRAGAGNADDEQQLRVQSQVMAVRVSAAKMDALMEAVGELTVAQSQLQAGVDGSQNGAWLRAQTQRLGAVARRLQDATLRLRMVPVEPVFLRVSRQAHELSRRLGKAMRMDLHGGDTEIDRGVAEELAEPLIHLIRNAMDHGLETPEQRKAAGKPEAGQLRLAAAHQGGEFVLTLTDDGRGLDPGKLLERGLACGLIAPGDTPDQARLFNLIFEPGFSTATEVTELSGRGVGLEAVRQRVHGMKGRVEVDSVLGQGCRFVLRLPLTLALLEAIVVRSGDQRFLLPASQVRRFVDGVSAKRHQGGDGNAWIEAGGSLSLVDLRCNSDSRGVLVHVEQGGREAGLLVDEVLGKQQAVAKSLGAVLKEVGPYTGGAVLGDGSVGLILDLDALLHRGGTAEKLLIRS